MKSFRTLIELFEEAGAPVADLEPDDFSDSGDYLAAAARAYRHETVFQTRIRKGPQRGEFERVSFSELLGRARNLAAGLLQLGLQPGDRVGLLADNRLEWMLADLAVLLNGALDVPRGSDSTADEMAYILEHSGSRICFVENEDVLRKVLAAPKAAQPRDIILMEGNAPRSDTPRVHTLAEIEALANETATAEVRVRSRSVRSSDSFTLIYTSGTTGRPKGVELTHANMVYNVNEVPPMVGVRHGERCLSILPIWHVFERALEYGLLPYGCELTYSSIRDLRGDFSRVRPTFMASAPRLWENIYDGLKAKLEDAEPQKRRVFDAALACNRTFSRSLSFLRGNELGVLPADQPARRIREWLLGAGSAVPALLLDQIVFRKIRDALGGCLRGTISGGGALPPHVDEFFNLIGIPVYEGYGMTECSPIISVRRRGRVVQGSVGFTPPGTEVRILAEDGRELPRNELGVIHVRGPQVMKGYFRDADSTTKVLRDGWLNTGDLGFISRNGTLSIRGRAKDTIVLLGGENVEPEPIESRLRESPYVDQVMVVGQDRKSLGALICPNITLLQSEGLLGESDAELADVDTNEELRRHFAAAIRGLVNAEAGFKSFERITGFALLPRPFAVGTELTNLFKLKRNVIAELYREQIDRLYGTSAQGVPSRPAGSRT